MTGSLVRNFDPDPLNTNIRCQLLGLDALHPLSFAPVIPITTINPISGQLVTIAGIDFHSTDATVQFTMTANMSCYDFDPVNINFLVVILALFPTPPTGRPPYYGGGLNIANQPVSTITFLPDPRGICHA